MKYIASKDVTVTLNVKNISGDNATFTINGEETTIGFFEGIEAPDHVREFNLKSGEVLEVLELKQNTLIISIL